ncbi:MAG: hypothetical protein ABIO83_09410 [Ilumatobacteraceae bacterium]
MGPEINTEILYKAQIIRARVAESPTHLDWSEQAERMATRKVLIGVSTSKRLVFASFLGGRIPADPRRHRERRLRR